MFDGIIIGGGAAGLFAAGTLKKGNYLLLEGEANVGNKLRIAGAGQCNFTFNEYPNVMMTRYGDHGKKIKYVLKTLTAKKLMMLFDDLGVSSLIREDGKVFPATLKSEDIIAALLRRINKDVVSIRTKTRVRSILRLGDSFIVKTDDDEFHCRKLLVATGGGSFRRTGSDGHGLTMVNGLGVSTEVFRPALIPVKVRKFKLGDLAGISVNNGSITFNGVTKSGDLLITAMGFSGPVIINNSRWLSSDMNVGVNFTDKSPDEIDKDLQILITENGTETVRFIVNQLAYPQRLLRLLWEDYLEIKLGELSKSQRLEMVQALCNYQVTIDLYPLDQGMATAGGVMIDDIDFKTMETKSVKGLYVAGEITDIDGDTGGYNIHYAFASGFIAATAMEQ